MKTEFSPNITLAANVANMVLLTGIRQFDRFITTTDTGEQKIATLPNICNHSTQATAMWIYDPAHNQVSLFKHVDSFNIDKVGDLPKKLGEPRDLDLGAVLSAFGSIQITTEQRLVLLINAGLLFEDPGAPRDDDFKTVRLLENFSHRTEKNKLLILRIPKTTCIPSSILSIPTLKIVNLPPAQRDERHAYARLRGQACAARCKVELNELGQTIAAATEDFCIEQIEALLQTAQRECTNLVAIDELARALRVGNSSSPWAGNQIWEAVGNAEEALSQRVKGQPQAIDAITESLSAAVVGLVGAHQDRSANSPRGIFFFAGPTGTGKTELCKAISNLIFGQEQLLRFDCGELRQEHAVARLIGSPPGYIGHDKGGELTEGIRIKPNSIVLFDEIEKAHPRLLDTLLAVLDDGRLTDGQGQTVYFGQSIIVFTSNLGIYKEVSDGMGGTMRQPRFNYSTPFDEIQKEIRKAIRHEFISTLNRPELLGRLGGEESIVVFDYLRDLSGVTKKFISNIIEKCSRLHGIIVTVDDSIVNQVTQVTSNKPETLLLGGRGLAAELDRMLTRPLAKFIFNSKNSVKSIHITWRDGKISFS